MKTKCPTCGAEIAGRQYLTWDLGLPVFFELYACGAVRAYGHVDGDGVIRQCESQKTG
jgi:hypothetical protein